jgi:predicted transcriptional regulator
MVALPSIEEIKKRRKMLGLSQKGLAERIGVSQSLIAKIESGKVKPSYEVVKKVFELFESLEKPKVGYAKDIKSSNVVWVSKDDKISYAVSLMFKHGFSQLPVIDKNSGMCVGSIYEKSIARKMFSLDNPKELYGRRVEDVMEEQFPVVDEDTPIPVIAALLQYCQAVLTAKKGRITGIITNSDLISSVAKTNHYT